tara:strand:+ start:56 stop:340 length:285 start_codon:yes stop_codon:yes gene_type:complete
VKSTNLRNKPIDRRRLNKQDREQYNPGPRQQAVAKARGRKGQLAYDAHAPRGTQEHKPGTGGISLGRSAQGARQREEGARVERSKSFRPEDPMY